MAKLSEDCRVNQRLNLSERYRRSVQTAIDEWNEQGGLLGRPIKLVKADTHMSVDEGIRALDHLVETEHVDLIVSSCLDDVSMRILPRIAEKGGQVNS